MISTEQESGSVPVKFHSAQLNHGFFQLTLPHSWQVWIVWAVALILLIIAFIFYQANLDTADAVPVDEAIRLEHPDQPHQLEQLGLGFDDGEEGAWLYLEGEITQGVIARGHCVKTKNGWNDDTSAVDEGPITILPRSGESYQIKWTERTWGPEINEKGRGCPGVNWVITTGSHLKMFILDDGETLWLFSAGEGDNEPSEVTDREDGQRWSMTFAMLGCMMLMFSTPTSLSQDLKRLRGGKEGRKLIHVKNGESSSVEMERSADSHDWVLPPPRSEVFLKDPWASGPEENLIPEHPKIIGTPEPATITFYSLAAIGFVTFTIWLSADLLARHGSTFHFVMGNILRFGIVIFTAIWAKKSYDNWKVIHNVKDTPTSTIRSVAVGPAEIVGQAIPMPSGTLTAQVGKSPEREVKGCLAYFWTEEEHVRRGKSSTWVTRNSEKKIERFIIHDGTGGIIVEPNTFEKREWGGQLKRWGGGKWRWTIHAITAYDPIYCLGRVEKRNADDLENCPSDNSVQQSLLVMRGNKDIGMETKFTRGTELGLMRRTRSTFELLVVPLLMLSTAAIPFFW